MIGSEHAAILHAGLNSIQMLSQHTVRGGLLQVGLCGPQCRLSPVHERRAVSDAFDVGVGSRGKLTVPQSIWRHKNCGRQASSFGYVVKAASFPFYRTLIIEVKRRYMLLNRKQHKIRFYEKAATCFRSLELIPGKAMQYDPETSNPKVCISGAHFQEKSEYFDIHVGKLDAWRFQLVHEVDASEVGDAGFVVEAVPIKPAQTRERVGKVWCITEVDYFEIEEQVFIQFSDPVQPAFRIFNRSDHTFVVGQDVHRACASLCSPWKCSTVAAKDLPAHQGPRVTLPPESKATFAWFKPRESLQLSVLALTGEERWTYRIGNVQSHRPLLIRASPKRKQAQIVDTGDINDTKQRIAGVSSEQENILVHTCVHGVALEVHFKPWCRFQNSMESKVEIRWCYTRRNSPGGNSESPGVAVASGDSFCLPPPPMEEDEAQIQFRQPSGQRWSQSIFVDPLSADDRSIIELEWTERTAGKPETLCAEVRLSRDNISSFVVVTLSTFVRDNFFLENKSSITCTIKFCDADVKDFKLPCTVGWAQLQLPPEKNNNDFVNVTVNAKVVTTHAKSVGSRGRSMALDDSNEVEVKVNLLEAKSYTSPPLCIDVRGGVHGRLVISDAFTEHVLEPEPSSISSRLASIETLSQSIKEITGKAGVAFGRLKAEMVKTQPAKQLLVKKRTVTAVLARHPTDRKRKGTTDYPMNELSVFQGRSKSTVTSRISGSGVRHLSPIDSTSSHLSRTSGEKKLRSRILSGLTPPNLSGRATVPQIVASCDVGASTAMPGLAGRLEAGGFCVSLADSDVRREVVRLHVANVVCDLKKAVGGPDGFGFEVELNLQEVQLDIMDPKAGGTATPVLRRWTGHDWLQGTTNAPDLLEPNERWGVGGYLFEGKERDGSGKPQEAPCLKTRLIGKVSVGEGGAHTEIEALDVELSSLEVFVDTGSVLSVVQWLFETELAFTATKRSFKDMGHVVAATARSEDSGDPLKKFEEASLADEQAARVAAKTDAPTEMPVFVRNLVVHKSDIFFSVLFDGGNSKVATTIDDRLKELEHLLKISVAFDLSHALICLGRPSWPSWWYGYRSVTVRDKFLPGGISQLLDIVGKEFANSLLIQITTLILSPRLLGSPGRLLRELYRAVQLLVTAAFFCNPRMLLAALLLTMGALVASLEGIVTNVAKMLSRFCTGSVPEVLKYNNRTVRTALRGISQFGVTWHRRELSREFRSYRKKIKNSRSIFVFMWCLLKGVIKSFVCILSVLFITLAMLLEAIQLLLRSAAISICPRLQIKHATKKNALLNGPLQFRSGAAVQFSMVAAMVMFAVDSNAFLRVLSGVEWRVRKLPYKEGILAAVRGHGILLVRPHKRKKNSWQVQWQAVNIDSSPELVCPVGGQPVLIRMDCIMLFGHWQPQSLQPSHRAVLDSEKTASSKQEFAFETPEAALTAFTFITECFIDSIM
eukprot:TRINITY_DN28196_c0_g3_i1.p1 TRINITY_DN28196_c0_g3~~TRINITY_DN28196_c0_g3_i1.p1  ORF type:complete len:1472 (-),score=207.25 TRINITY_DN28196_c0_g3_i1:164-4495(-)